MSPKLGVLGGMGPMATVDFLHKLVDRTPARADHEHIPTITHSVPQLPDRMQAIFEGGASPLPSLIEAIETLQAAGAVCIAMPCNTAHYWYDEFAPAAKVPFLHIADAAMAALRDGDASGIRLGLMGTRGTLKAGFFQQRFSSRGFDCVVTSAADQEQLVDPAITAIKANELDRATPLLERAAESLLGQGATTVVLACTEIPVVLHRFQPALQARCIDVTVALADACIAWWQANHKTA
ncbi:MAG: amino acid racemase [Betaproteobacteria bacterium]|nr:amino acid racemase [Betaproteobacteria bacterium]